MLEPTDYDNPWKEALAHYLAPFLKLCFPQAHAGIDWSRGYRLLDQELRQVTRRASSGLHRVDVLAQVWRTDGSEAWVLVHVEVQTRRERGFERRMWRYNARLLDLYDRPVATFGVLADTDPSWRPGSYVSELWGCRASLEFPTVKLLDFDEAELAASANPIAVLIRAHRRAQATRRSPERRLRSKIEVVRDLYRTGLARQDVLELLRLVDWLLALPKEQDDKFWDEVITLEEKGMPYVTSWERRGMTRGREEGRQEGRQEALHQLILENLELENGKVPDELAARVTAITDQERLKELARASARPEGLDAFRRRLED